MGATGLLRRPICYPAAAARGIPDMRSLPYKQKFAQSGKTITRFNLFKSLYFTGKKHLRPAKNAARSAPLLLSVPITVTVPPTKKVP
jgi:hypothetical protein